MSRTAVDNDAPQRPPDAVESFVYHGHAGRDKLPSEAALPGFASALGRYWGELEALTRALMSLSAAALGLEEDHFEAAYARHASVLRLAHYPPAAAAVSARGEGEAAAGRLRYGEHTDYIGFTILFQDDSPRPGLEVRMPGGEFVDVPPLPSTAADGADGGGGVSFTVNVADMIARWTNDRCVFAWGCPCVFVHACVRDAVRVHSARARGLRRYVGVAEVALTPSYPPARDRAVGQRQVAVAAAPRGQRRAGSGEGPPQRGVLLGAEQRHARGVPAGLRRAQVRARGVRGVPQGQARGFQRLRVLQRSGHARGVHACTVHKHTPRRTHAHSHAHTHTFARAHTPPCTKGTRRSLQRKQ